MALFYCVTIAYLLILWNGPFVQAEQTATPDEKVLHRRASGPTPYDIRNVYLESYEDLTSIGVPAVYICQNSIYRKYLNDYSTLDEIELTNEQLDELFYSLVFGTLTRFRIELLGITQTFISVKNFPDGMRYNLESNWVGDNPKFLIGNKLNLGICRLDRTNLFEYEFIRTDNRETIPPLKDLTKTTPISTSTSQTITTPIPTSSSSKTTTSPVQKSTTKRTTVIPIIQDCSFDITVKRKMTTLNENAFSKNDWIPALNNYSQIDRPLCLNKPTQQLSTCLCTVNRNLKTWVCEDQHFKAMEAILDCSLNDFLIALKYFREVFSICLELKHIVG